MSILDLARCAGDIPADDVAPGVLIFGPSGHGKTDTAFRGGRPLGIVLEGNAISTIRACNRKATIIRIGFDANGKPMLRPDGKPLSAREQLDQVRSAVQAAINGEIRAAGFDRIVFDSLTELQRLFRDEIIGSNLDKMRKKGKDVADDEDEGGMSLRMWGILADKMEAFLRTLRSLPIPVVATALAEDLGTGEVASIRPLFSGKTAASKIMQFFPAIGFAAKRVVEEEGEARTIYKTMFDGPARYALKSSGTVSGVRDPDILAFIREISERTAQE